MLLKEGKATTSIANRSMKFYFIWFLISVATFGTILVYLLDNRKLLTISMLMKRQIMSNRANEYQKLSVIISEPPNASYLEANQFSIGGGQLGNQMFLYISTLCAAKTLNRTAFIAYFEIETISIFAGLVRIFPNLANAYSILLRNRKEIKYAGIGGGRCCYYDDLEKYRRYDNDRYISSGGLGAYFQSYKYVHPYRDQLLNYYLLFDQSYIDLANSMLDKFAIKAHDLKQRPTICVHLRRTNFLNSWLYVSPGADFVRNTVQFVRKQLYNRYDASRKLAVFLISDDYEFQKTIFDGNNLSENMNAYILPIENERPAVHWAFAAQYCRAIIIGAPRSTFGWWLAYLSGSATVYYNYDAENGNVSEMVREDFFPPEWIPLRFNNVSGSVTQMPGTRQKPKIKKYIQKKLLFN